MLKNVRFSRALICRVWFGFRDGYMQSLQETILDNSPAMYDHNMKKFSVGNTNPWNKYICHDVSPDVPQYIFSAKFWIMIAYSFLRTHLYTCTVFLLTALSALLGDSYMNCNYLIRFLIFQTNTWECNCYRSGEAVYHDKKFGR